MVEQVVFDLDFTLIDFDGNLYPEVESILQYLHEKDIKMYIASHNLDGKEIIKNLNLDKYFTGYSIGYPKDCPDKTENLKELKLDKKKCVFFDDDIRIVSACMKDGWNVVRVRNGVTMKVILELFE